MSYRCGPRGRAELGNHRFLSRTPGASPLVNSTPACSRVPWITATVARRGSVPSPSNCRTVAMPICACAASSCWLHFRRPLAARHWAGVIMRRSWASGLSRYSPSSSINKQSGWLWCTRRVDFPIRDSPRFGGAFVCAAIAQDRAASAESGYAVPGRRRGSSCRSAIPR